MLGKFTDFFRYQTRLAFLLEIDAGYCLNVKNSGFVMTSIVKKIETVE